MESSGVEWSTVEWVREGDISGRDQVLLVAGHATATKPETWSRNTINIQVCGTNHIQPQKRNNSTSLDTQLCAPQQQQQPEQQQQRKHQTPIIVEPFSI